LTTPRSPWRDRHLLYGIALVVVAVLVVGACFAGNYFLTIAVATRTTTAIGQARNATAADAALHAAQVSGCQAGNQERAGELALWTYLFHASKPASSQQAAAIAKFMDLVNSTFAPRNCSAVYSLTPQKGDGHG
jgi:uncharacterized iron-regulated membrane protein